MENQKPKIVVSEEMKKHLDRVGRKGETYDDVLKRLLKNVKKDAGVSGGDPILIMIKKCQKEIKKLKEGYKKGS